ncbi:hypothetical protein [Flavobacterium agri]|uniref:hypothetical protein n=1 Tax=Flavobacterium agri TaxID=2743471 RepID=UPI001C52ACA1|nr:hypothetical protein [Flavobacterium agri]
MIAFIAVLNVFYGRRSGIFADYKIEFSVVMAIAATIGFFYHMNRIRTVVTEVQISDSKFKIFGYDFNSKFEDDLDLSKTFIEVVEEYVGKNNSVYCLEIMCEDKFYYINKSSDWNYQVLIDLINEYSLKTGKVIPSLGLLKGA